MANTNRCGEGISGIYTYLGTANAIDLTSTRLDFEKTYCISFKIASEMQERIVVDDADWKVEVKGDIAFIVRTHVAALMLNSRREKKRKTNTLTHTHTLSRSVSEGPDTIQCRWDLNYY